MEPMQFIDQIANDITTAIIALLAAYILNTLHKLTEKAKLETKKLKKEEQRKLLLDALDDIEILTKMTVTEIEQTTAQTLREAVKNGVKDRAELESLSKKAFNEIADALKPEAKTLIEKQFGDFAKYLTKTIETKVFELKNGL